MKSVTFQDETKGEIVSMEDGVCVRQYLSFDKQSDKFEKFWPQQFSTAAEIESEAKIIESPSDEQKEAGNYRMGHISIHGLPITLEYGRGQVRSGDGWSVKLAHHYGYIKRTESDADGDHVDVFVGPNPESEIIFVIDQLTKGGKFDEHKCMLGFNNESDAEQGYLDCYSKGWKCGPITAMTIEQFKEWIERGDTGARASKQFAKDEPCVCCPVCGGESETCKTPHANKRCKSCRHFFVGPVSDISEDEPEDTESVPFEKFWGEPMRFEGYRAKEGGETSPVNGKFYEGGEFMPVHGKSEKTSGKSGSKKPYRPRKVLGPNGYVELPEGHHALENLVGGHPLKSHLLPDRAIAYLGLTRNQAEEIRDLFNEGHAYLPREVIPPSKFSNAESINPDWSIKEKFEEYQKNNPQQASRMSWIDWYAMGRLST